MGRARQRHGIHNATRRRLTIGARDFRTGDSR
jgi:hypothetical protein